METDFPPTFPHLPSISSTFYARVFRTKVLFSSDILAKKDLSYKKQVRKTLMKLTPSLYIEFEKIKCEENEVDTIRYRVYQII